MSLSEPSQRSLNGLLHLFGVKNKISDDIYYKHFHVDSRKIKPGWVFFAVNGEAVDGRDFIPQAIDNGAIAVVAEKSAMLPDSYESKGVMVYVVNELGKKIGKGLAQLFKNPSNHMKVTGITGTNGKTSCSFFLAQILTLLSVRAGVIGTIGNGIYPDLEISDNTTPNSYEIQSTLSQWVTEDISQTVMEVSSHALCQGRVDGVCFETALFTNISHDHLDYHKTMQAYVNAKLQLFRASKLKNAVINIDDVYGTAFIKAVPESANIVTYALTDRSADIYLENIQRNGADTRANITTPWGKGLFVTSLYGKFNLYNVLGIIGVLGCQGIATPKILNAIKVLGNVPGRMEVYGKANQTPMVIVDYAHTPDALKNALSAIREQHQQKIICVFGCGGDRDRGKRALMMDVALTHADAIILTNDNPRFEAPDQIIEDAMATVDARSANRVKVIKERGKAIRYSIIKAKPSDVILIAGKGHENYQEICGVKYNFDDREKIKKTLLMIT